MHKRTKQEVIDFIGSDNFNQNFTFPDSDQLADVLLNFFYPQDQKPKRFLVFAGANNFTPDYSKSFDTFKEAEKQLITLHVENTKMDRSEIYDTKKRVTLVAKIPAKRKTQ